MKVAGESESLAAVNRVPIHRALVFADEEHPADTLTPYLTILDKYDPAKLDPAGLLQLVRAFDQAGLAARAAKAGQAGILAEREPTEAEAALTAVRSGRRTCFRDRLDEPERGAQRSGRRPSRCSARRPGRRNARSRRPTSRSTSSSRTETAKALLDSATARLGQGGDAGLDEPPEPGLGRLVRSQGRRTLGPGRLRPSHGRARRSRKSAVEQDAWRGALSRSTEEFLRSKAFDRAWAELRRWQEEYPIDKVEGYLTLLQARYWAARSRWPQAIALAGDLVAINPDSPYADRLVFLAAECEEELGPRRPRPGRLSDRS